VETLVTLPERKNPEAMSPAQLKRNGINSLYTEVRVVSLKKDETNL